MLESQSCIQDFEELQSYVTKTLSELEFLKTDCCQLTVRRLVRGGVPCGIYFCLHGPRDLRLSAIWETDSNSILFYGSQGERVQKTKLLRAPTLPDLE